MQFLSVTYNNPFSRFDRYIVVAGGEEGLCEKPSSSEVKEKGRPSREGSRRKKRRKERESAVFLKVTL